VPRRERAAAHLSPRRDCWDESHEQSRGNEKYLAQFSSAAIGADGTGPRSCRGTAYAPRAISSVERSLMRTGLFVVTCVFVMGTASARAQQVSYEILGGMDIATLPGFGAAVDDPTLETGFRGGGTIGGGVEIELTPFVSLRTSVMFVRKGLQLEGGDMRIPAGAHVDLDYAEFPILVMFAPTDSPGRRVRPYVGAGAMFGVNSRAKMSSSIVGLAGDTIDIDDDVRDWEGGVVATAGVTIAHRFRGEVRFSQGLTNVIEEHRQPLDSVHTRTISFLGGVRF
jgi:hypothetical protein